MPHERNYQPSDYVSGNNVLLGSMFAILFAYLIIAGIALGGGGGFGKMFWHRSKGGNYVEKFGFSSSMINMGIMGFIGVAYVFATGGHFNGCLFACIFTAVGFAANGVSVRMYLPTMIGVAIGALLTGGIAGAIAGESFVAAALVKVASRGMLLAAIFSCGMAPIVGEHGLLAGLFVGVVHSMLVPNTGAFHGFMSLYNNGLSMSLIATFLMPVYTLFGKKKEAPAAG